MKIGELLDGAYSFIADTGMRREPRHLQPEHQRSALRGHDRQVRRLRDDRAVGNVPPQDGGQGAGATIFFRDRALDNDITVWSESRLLECPQGKQIVDDTALHVAGAPAVEALVI